MNGEPEVEPPPAPDDPGLPLALLDARLAPLRRVVAWGVGHPDRVAWFEANAERWLGPLLASDLPDPVRELLVGVAGQVSGFDQASLESRRVRLERMRQVLTRADALLGLPLPRADRGLRPKLRRICVDEAVEEEPSRPEGQPTRRAPEPRAPAPPADDEELDLDGVLEVEDDDEDDDEAPGERRSGGWTGNPHAALDALGAEPELLAGLRAAGLVTVGDLLFRPPASVEVLRPIHGAGRDLPEGRVAVGGRLQARWTVFGPRGLRRAEATLFGAGPVRMVWSPGSPSAWWLDAVAVGDRAVVAGTWDGVALRDPELVFEDDKCVRVLRYGLPGVDDTRLAALLHRVLPLAKGVRDPLPPTARGGRLSLADALVALHGRGDAEAARQRLAFDEAVLVALGQGWARGAGQRARGIAHAVVHGKVDRLLRGLDVRLDDDQERAFDDIRRDFRRSRPMKRVLTGPPGGRKGLIALLAAAMVAEGKSQVLWLASDAASADVRFTYAEPLLRELGFTARLLSDPPNGGARDAVRRGEAHVVFGTDALLALAEPLEFRRLGLVISTERDRLGTVSLRVEEMKPPRPDLLVVSAAAPTAEAMLGPWAGHDLTHVPGATPPDVVLKVASQRDAAYAPARHALLGGAQVAVLWPQRGGADALDPSEARQVVTYLAESAMPGARVSLLHGSMSREERSRVFTDLVHRRQDAVFATGPLEDLPPVPGLSVVVVENAHVLEPLRLSRLAGMGAGQVILVVPDDTPEVRREELRAVVRGERGVPVASADGVVLPPFVFLDPRTDGAAIVEARAVVGELLASDAGLRSATWSDLLRMAHARWGAVFPGTACPLPEPGEASAPRRKRRRRRRR